MNDCGKSIELFGGTFRCTLDTDHVAKHSAYWTMPPTRNSETGRANQTLTPSEATRASNGEITVSVRWMPRTCEAELQSIYCELPTGHQGHHSAIDTNVHGVRSRVEWVDMTRDDDGI